MSRSRSCSLPRERSTRRYRSPSRSSHDRRLSRRSKSSRSPVDRRRRSRSRSRSPSVASSRSGSDDRHHKKHRKYSKKEEKKRHKKHKRGKDNEREETATAATPEENENDEEVKKQPTDSAPVDARSFFEQLQKQESAKEPVGTVHSRGLPAPVSATAISTADKWECSKAGCGHMNSKHAPACNKCGAMKRMTEWR
ncbi:hypothetical protein PI124_g18288 [Phytophthora idaei]|nr:hypothetical protein PI125_g19046 [Phytophthora idaei]KAG3137719.1 hypothetical protein PI126_g17243 [Phytophthora idaei]KAG3236707.1 hypothetical protein PI124_g18288 [Phytophthora idaei]